MEENAAPLHPKLREALMTPGFEQLRDGQNMAVDIELQDGAHDERLVHILSDRERLEPGENQYKYRARLTRSEILELCGLSEVISISACILPTIPGTPGFNLVW